MTFRTAHRTLRRTRQPDRDSAAPAGRSVPAVAVRPSLCEALEQRMLLALNSPTNLVASQATSLAVNLTWTASPIPPSFSNYQIARSTIPNDPSPQIIGTIPYDQTSYTDVDDVNSPVSPDGRYYYRVRAMAYNADWSPYSNEVEMLPWASRDVGYTTPAGSASYSGGTFTVSGAGADIIIPPDQFRFVYRKLAGDGALIAKVNTQGNTGSGWAKSGVMFRETLAADAKYTMMAITPANGPFYQRRDPWANSDWEGGTAGFGNTPAPYWVKLTRTIETSGINTFRGYVSPDGATWTEVSSAYRQVSASLASSLYVGLVVTSHQSGVLNTTTFTQAELGTPATPTALNVTTSAGQANLTWTDNSRIETGYVVERSTNGINYTTVATLGAGATSHVDPVPAGGTFRYRVRATHAAGNSLPSNVYLATVPPALATPANFRATPATVNPKVYVEWQDVSGETGYVLERSPNGTDWATRANIAADSYSYTDTDVTKGATYHYRLKAIKPGGVASAWTPTRSATTSSYRLLDGNRIANKPSLASHGLPPAVVTGVLLNAHGPLEHWDRKPDGTLEDGADVNTKLFNETAWAAWNAGGPFVIDIEVWPWTKDRLKEVVRAINVARTSYTGTAPVEVRQFGITEFPTRTKDMTTAQYQSICDVWAGFDSVTGDYDEDHDLIKALDFISPESYLVDWQDLGEWKDQHDVILAAARNTIDRARPAGVVRGELESVCMALNPTLYRANQPARVMSADLWQFVLAANRSHTDSGGALLWSAHETYDGAQGWAGPDHQAWWARTLQFMDRKADLAPPWAPTQPPLATPVVTAPDPVGNPFLRWSYDAAAPQPDGFKIERSADGANWYHEINEADGAQLVTWPWHSKFYDNSRNWAVGGARQWADPDSDSGQTFYYRVTAFTATGSSAASAPVLLTNPTVDATAPTTASRWAASDGSPETRNEEGNVTINNGSTLTYHRIDFGNDPRVNTTAADAKWTTEVGLSIADWSGSFGGGSVNVIVSNDAGQVLATTTLPIPQPTVAGTKWVQGALPATMTGRHNVRFEFFEGTPSAGNGAVVSFQVGQAITLNTDSTGHAYSLRLQSDPQKLGVWTNSTATGSPAWEYWFDRIDLFRVKGAGAGTTLNIDASNGNPIPVSGIPLAAVGTPVKPTITVTGTPGNDFLQHLERSVGLNWRTITFAPEYQVSRTYVHFATGGGRDAIGVAGWRSFVTLTAPAPQNGIRRIDLSSVTIGANGPVLVAPSNTDALVVVDELSMLYSNHSTVDLGRSDLALGKVECFDAAFQGFSPIRLLRALIGVGRRGGTWAHDDQFSNIGGITSSAAAAAAGTGTRTALGYALNDGSSAFWQSYGTQLLSEPTLLLVRYTLEGDTNLDRAVSYSPDFETLDANFGATGLLGGWQKGDFDYDGDVDFVDYQKQEDNFGKTL